jgi:small subunit ribosomal protein S5
MPEKIKKAERTAEDISEELLEKEITKELKVEDKRTDEEKRRDSRLDDEERAKESRIASWVPKTKLGKEVKLKTIKNIDEIIDAKKKILEDQIVDSLLNVKSDLLFIGQSKGKFGGGKRRAWKQTQRKTKEGNVATFATLSVIGDENGHVGIGFGRAKETLPARDKSIRQAKLAIIKVTRACASFDCACEEKHSIPFIVTGKSGSVRVTLIPAPQGTGLVAAGEMKKILKLAGVKDIYSKTSGTVSTTMNLAKATIDALKKTNKVMENKQ